MASPTSHALDGIDLIGPRLDGAAKYSSAVAVGDCVYAVPDNAEQVMRINCKTGEVHHIGPHLDGGSKYFSAVAVDNCVYALPWKAEQVMRVNCKTGKVQHIGPHLHGRVKYFFSAVAVNDCVYAVPWMAEQVMRINCKTGDFEHIGPHLHGRVKYRSAVAVNDCVYAIPCDAQQVMRINCKTGEVHHIGPHLDGGSKYSSAVAVDNCVYALPWKAEQVMRINCKTGEVHHIGPHLDGGSKYFSAVAVNDCVYAIPCDAQQVMRINCKTGEVHHIGPRLDGAAKYSSAVAVDNCVYAIPENAEQVMRISCKALPSVTHAVWAEGVEAPAAGMRHFYPSGFSVSRDVPEAIAQFGHTADQITAILAAGEKKASKSPMAISKEHSAALYAYTEDSPLYRQLNYAMRTPSTPSNPTDNQLKLFADYIFHAERALNCMPTHVSSIAGPVFRGVNTLLNPAIYAPGKRITWQAFTSSTRKQAVTLTFLDKLPGRKLQGSVFIIQSSTAKDISFFSEYPHEEEVVFAPNSGFQVEKVLRTEGEKQSVLSDLAAYDMSDLDVYLLHQVA